MSDITDRLRVAEAHLSDADPVMKNLIAKCGHCGIAPHTDYYRQLVRAIVGQQLSVKAAASIYNRLLSHFDDAVPTPEQFMIADTEILRGLGLSYAKISYIKDLAGHIIDGRLDLKHIATLPNEVVVEQLVAVKGIGEWSAHMFMLFCLGRLDILPTGDLGIRKAMLTLYTLPELPKPAAMLEIALKHKWSPYQSVASWYLWRSLE